MEETSLTVHIDPALLDKVQLYCDMHATDPSTVVAALLDNFMTTKNDEMMQLVHGYMEMASLNTQICHEFTACESEAYGHIR